MHRDRIILLLAPVALALAATVSCTTSLPVDARTGAAGTSAGAAGQTGGAAGSQGAAGTAAGAAGAGAAGAGAAGAGVAGSGATDAGAAGAGAAGAGAAGTTADAAVEAIPMLSFATDILPIINTKCHDCHQTGKDGMLDMTAANAYMSLVGLGSGGAVLQNTNCKIGGTAITNRVLPGDPAHSLMYLKITTLKATLTAGNCGATMPNNMTQLGTSDAADTQKIHDWIAGGANP
jgi:hypothetical protein